MAQPFPLTISAVKEMNDLLTCKICNKFMQEPVSLWACDHMFCRLCIEGRSSCPTCSLPIWHQDRRSQQKMADIAKAFSQLQNCLDVSTHCQAISKEQLKPEVVESENQHDVHQTDVSTSKCHKFNACLSPLSKASSADKLNTSLARPKSVSKNKRGETPLHLAAIHGDMDKLIAILDEGADVNCKDNAGWSPLHEACNKGHTAIVKQLLDAGAFIDIPGYENETPLMDAVANNNLETVRLLLQCGADVHQRKVDGRTAFSFACSQEMSVILDSHAKNHTNLQENGDSEASTVHASSEMCHTLACSSEVDISLVKSTAKVLCVRINKESALNVTHFVAKSCENGRPRRTLKYLQAVACGAWIVKESWLHECRKNGGWVSELNYQYTSCVEDTIVGGPLRSVIGRLRLLPRLFDSCHFFLYGTYSHPSPSKAQLCELIKAADGQILTREPKPDSDCIQTCTKVPYHAKSDTDMYYYTYYTVYDPSQAVLPRLIRQGKVCSVPYSWVLDCLSQFIICDIV